LKRLQDDLNKLHQNDLDAVIKDSDLRKDQQNQEILSVRNILKDPEMTSDEFLDLKIISLKIPEDKKQSLKRMQDELKQLHEADLIDTMQNPDKRQELEFQDLEAARKLVKNPSLTLGEFLELNIPAIQGLTEDKKTTLMRLQEEEQFMHKKDLQDAIEDQDKRHDLEYKEMDLVRNILGQDISLSDFMKLNIDKLKNLKLPQKSELKRLQEELRKMDQADVADENNNLFLTEKDRLLAISAEILGEPIEVSELLDLEIDELPNLPQSDKLKLKEIQDRLSELIEDDLLDRKSRKKIEMDDLSDLSEPDQVNLKEMQDRLSELLENDLLDKISRKEIEMDGLSKSRIILNNPELSLENLLDLDIAQLKLQPDEKKELTKIQDELKLAHQADLKDALENENDRKNLEKEEMKAVNNILPDKVDLEEFIDLDLNSIKDIVPDKLQE